MNKKIIQSFNLRYNKETRQKLLESSQEYSPGFYHMTGKTTSTFCCEICNLYIMFSLWALFWGFTSWCWFCFVLYFFQMVLSFLQTPRVFPAHTGHRRFPTEETDSTTEQVQPSGSAAGSIWAFAVFCHSMCHYDHPCFPRLSSFWSFLPTFRSFLSKRTKTQRKECPAIAISMCS